MKNQLKEWSQEAKRKGLDCFVFAWHWVTRSLEHLNTTLTWDPKTYSKVKEKAFKVIAIRMNVCKPIHQLLASSIGGICSYNVGATHLFFTNYGHMICDRVFWELGILLQTFQRVAVSSNAWMTQQVWDASDSGLQEAWPLRTATLQPQVSQSQGPC